MSKQKLQLILFWHMHQPDYRDSESGQFRLPWTYLHALKDYSDMVAHIEAEPRARAVFNFVPVLLDQLEDYAEQLATAHYRDPLLGLLARENFSSLTPAERDFLLDYGFRCGHEQMVSPYPHYKRLHELYDHVEKFGAGISEERVTLENFRFREFLTPGRYPFRMECLENRLNCRIYRGDKILVTGVITKGSSTKPGE